MNVRCIVVAALLAGFAGAPARAHHSVEEQYDIARLDELSGTITKVELVNPHVVIELATAGAEPATWQIELAPPNALQRRGIDLRKLLSVGRAITIESWLAKDGGRQASGRQLVTADGARFDVGDGLGRRMHP